MKKQAIRLCLLSCLLVVGLGTAGCEYYTDEGNPMERRIFNNVREQIDESVQDRESQDGESEDGTIVPSGDSGSSAAAAFADPAYGSGSVGSGPSPTATLGGTTTAGGTATAGGMTTAGGTTTGGAATIACDVHADCASGDVCSSGQCVPSPLAGMTTPTATAAPQSSTPARLGPVLGSVPQAASTNLLTVAYPIKSGASDLKELVLLHGPADASQGWGDGYKFKNGEFFFTGQLNLFYNQSADYLFVAASEGKYVVGRRFKLTEWVAGSTDGQALTSLYELSILWADTGGHVIAGGTPWVAMLQNGDIHGFAESPTGAWFSTGGYSPPQLHFTFNPVLIPRGLAAGLSTL